MRREMTFEEFRYMMMAGFDDSITQTINNAIQVLSGKWKLQILYAISTSERIRFNELKRKLPGITSRQLISDLRSLEEQSFIQKTVSDDSPDIKEYAILDKARDLIYLFYDYMNWGFSYAKN